MPPADPAAAGAAATDTLEQSGEAGTEMPGADAAMTGSGAAMPEADTADAPSAAPGDDALPEGASDPMKVEPALGTPEPASAMTSPLPAGASLASLMKAGIFNTEGEEIAEIRDFVLGEDGVVEQVIIQFGDILGFGGKTTALEIGELQESAGEENRFVVSMDKEQLEALPDYEQRDGRWTVKG